MEQFINIVIYVLIHALIKWFRQLV